MRRPKDHVLIIEDDTEIRGHLVSLFLQNAFQVDTARENPEAIEKLRNTEFSAIVINLKMVQSENNAVDFLRQEQPELLPRVVVITSAIENPFDTSDLLTFASQVRGLAEPESVVRAVRDCSNRPLWW